MLDCPSSGQTILSSIPICSIFPASFSSLGSFPLYHTEGASVRFKTDPTKWQLASFLFFFFNPKDTGRSHPGGSPSPPPASSNWFCSKGDHREVAQRGQGANGTGGSEAAAPPICLLSLQGTTFSPKRSGQMHIPRFPNWWEWEGARESAF